MKDRSADPADTVTDSRGHQAPGLESAGRWRCGSKPSMRRNSLYFFSFSCYISGPNIVKYTRVRVSRVQRRDTHATAAHWPRPRPRERDAQRAAAGGRARHLVHEYALTVRLLHASRYTYNYTYTCSYTGIGIHQYWAAAPGTAQPHVSLTPTSRQPSPTSAIVASRSASKRLCPQRLPPQKLSAPPPLLLLYSPPPPCHCGRAKRPGLIILPATETAVVPHLSHQRLVLLPACSLIYQRPALLPVGGAGETMVLVASSERSKRAVKTLPVPQSCG